MFRLVCSLSIMFAVRYTKIVADRLQMGGLVMGCYTLHALDAIALVSGLTWGHDLLPGKAKS